MLKFVSFTGLLSSHCMEYLQRGIALKAGKLHNGIICQRSRTELKSVPTLQRCPIIYRYKHTE